VTPVGLHLWGLEAVTADSSASLRNDDKKMRMTSKNVRNDCKNIRNATTLQKSEGGGSWWLVVGDDGFGLMGEVVVEEFVTAVVTVLDFEE
jgi:hypothetical protein